MLQRALPEQEFFCRMATGGTASDSMTVWDYEGRERLLTFGTDASLARTTFSPDGNVIAAQRGRRGSSGAVYFWRAPSWAEIEKADAAEAAREAGKPAP